MKKLISFMHISLDGFVAGPNGEMNWIKIDDELFAHVERRIGQTDAALYGRVTYQLMESYWPGAANKPNASRHDIEHSKWYKTAHKIVLSASMKGAELPNTTIISDNLAAQVNSIKQSGTGEILLFGSPSATHVLIQQGLIDGYWLFVNPVILGQGIPLFKDIREQIRLKAVPDTKRFASGITELNYLVEKDA